MSRSGKSGHKIQVLLKAGDGSQVPAQISVRQLVKSEMNGAAVGMVVTDTSESRRSEELLRALSHRLVQAQEAERGRVALELHDQITQLLCAVVVRCQTLADGLSSRDRKSKLAAIELREMVGQTVDEVERISRNLRPSVLDQIGLVAIVRDTSAEFTERTGVPLSLGCVELAARLPADTELTLYRILQEALKNVEKHARARQVIVSLQRQGAFVQLVVNDDGIGFDSDFHAGQKGKGGLGVLGMRERAAFVGGTLKIRSTRRAGTEIEVLIPATVRKG
jgi:signal transduction histidine kinase